MRHLWQASAALSISLLGTSAAAGWGMDYCSASRDLALEINLDGVTDITIEAVSGDLEIVGVRSPARVVAEGRACTEKKYNDQIDDIQIVSERNGSTLRIIAEVPRSTFTKSLIGKLDLTISVPDTLALSVFDSSGDTNIRNAGPLHITDSSGDIEIENSNGDVTVDVDSSGDLWIDGAGNVVIDVDSSGDIEIRDVLSVRIGKDSSGDIEVTRVAGDVYVGADSSGDIDARDVGGSLTVSSDGSGSIDYRSVNGSVSIPKNKRRDD